MRFTLLEMTQDILSAMDSDEINSITDSTEARQVVAVIKTCYGDIASLANLPHHYTLFTLTASGDSALPVTMTLPDDCMSVEWVKYDKQDVDNTEVTWARLQPMMLQDFLDMVAAFPSEETNVTEYVVPSGQTLFCYNDRAPTYYTTFDDGTLLFDSFDSAVDSTLQASKTMVWGQQSYPWSETDTFEFPLDERAQQMLLHKSKSLAFAELKQQQHAYADKSVRELKINSQQTKQKTRLQRALDRAPNYGR